MKRTCHRHRACHNYDSTDSARTHALRLAGARDSRAGALFGAGDDPDERHSPATPPTCILCYESTPVLLRPGCACRSDGGRDNSNDHVLHLHCAVRAITVHVDSLLESATRQHRLDDLPAGTFADAWAYCRVCHQQFTGDLAIALAQSFVAWSDAIDYDLHISARVQYATVLYQHGRDDECTATLLPLRDEFVSEENGIVIEAYLASCDTHRSSAARDGDERRLRAIHADARRRLGDESPVTLMLAQDLSVALLRLGRLDESVALAALVHSTQQRRRGAADPTTLSAAHQLGRALVATGRHTDAHTVLTDVYARTVRTFGPHHPRTLGVVESLSELAERRHRFDDAEVMRRRVYAGLRSAHPTDHPACVEARRALAMTLHAQDKLSECMSVLAECEEDGLVVRCADLVEEMRRRAARAYPTGTRVSVHSLSSESPYDNASGTVVRFDRRKIRYGVRFADGQTISIRFECVKAAPPGWVESLSRPS